MEGCIALSSPSPQPSPLVGEGEKGPQPVEDVESILQHRFPPPSVGEGQGEGQRRLADIFLMQFDTEML